VLPSLGSAPPSDALQQNTGKFLGFQLQHVANIWDEGVDAQRHPFSAIAFLHSSRVVSTSS